MKNKPGNTFQRAYDLGSLATNQNRSGRLQINDRNDFYSFSLSNRSSVSLSLNTLKANADLQLFRGDRALVTASRQPGKRPERISTTLDPGTYYLQVSSKNGKKSKTTYNLTAAATPILSPVPISIPSPVLPPVSPPVSPPPKQGNFEVSIAGFTVNRQTVDIENPLDGRHDEVFLRSQVHTQNLQNGTLTTKGVEQSRTMGQLLTRKRVQAGSGTPDFFDILAGRTTPGGLQTGDSFFGNSPLPPGYVQDMRLKDSIMSIWSGTLVSGQTAVYITPTIWDSDRAPEQDKPFRIHDSSSDLQVTSATGTFNPENHSTFWESLNHANQNVLFQSGRKLFGNQALGANSGLRDGDLFVTDMDRPIGMTRQGSDYSFDPLVLPLTYEMASFISGTTLTDKGKGTIALRYVDDSSLGGDYTLYLRVRPSPVIS
jgi:Bacterial pre-peptidase C-terminal domain